MVLQAHHSEPPGALGRHRQDTRDHLSSLWQRLLQLPWKGALGGHHLPSRVARGTAPSMGLSGCLVLPRM